MSLPDEQLSELLSEVGWCMRRTAKRRAVKYLIRRMMITSEDPPITQASWEWLHENLMAIVGMCPPSDDLLAILTMQKFYSLNKQGWQKTVDMLKATVYWQEEKDARDMKDLPETADKMQRAADRWRESDHSDESWLKMLMYVKQVADESGDLTVWRYLAPLSDAHENDADAELAQSLLDILSIKLKMLVDKEMDRV